MSYEWAEHTAELELHVSAASEELVLQSAMDGLAELLDGGPGPAATKQIRLEAPDRATLLLAWLEELLFLSETDGFIPEDAEIVMTSSGLEATVRGRIDEPRPVVKAITYHELEFEPADRDWRARVVLDV
jgi:SHS2 domain-containing protein